MQKKGFLFILVLVLVLMIPLSVEARVKSRINADEIPDMEYPVYLYSGHRPGSLLAVFDIPDDDFRVFMYHTALVRRGTGRPNQYVEKFQKKIKGFKTAYALRDKGGEVRGYLMGSRFVRYQFLVSDDEIGVRVRDYSNKVENQGVPLRHRQTDLLSREVRKGDAREIWAFYPDRSDSILLNLSY